jgi:hypothetical protein
MQKYMQQNCGTALIFFEGVLLEKRLFCAAGIGGNGETS